MMNSRERFKATLQGDKPGMPFLWESGFDDGAVERWHREGLPKGTNPFEYFGLDRVAQVNISTNLIPSLRECIIGDESGYLILEDEAGGIRRMLKKQSLKPSTRISTTAMIRWPLRDRPSWEILKSRLNPYSPERMAVFEPFLNGEKPAPDGRWSQISGFWGSYAKEDGYPIVLVFTGPTYWLIIHAGFENAAVMLYDDPELIHEIYEYYTWYLDVQLRYILSRRVPDAVFIGEEICYKGGLFMSPNMYLKYACPGLSRITDICRGAGIKLIFGESGGHISPVIPLWREIGINGLIPLDVSGGTDPVEIRMRYDDLLLIGGIDRTALENGREEICREINRTARVFYSEGRAIPCGDCHFAISDKVTFDNMCFYVDGLRELWQTI